MNFSKERTHKYYYIGVVEYINSQSQQLLEVSLSYIVQQILTAPNELLFKEKIYEIEKKQEFGKNINDFAFKGIINGCQSHYYSVNHQIEQIEQLIRNLPPFKLQKKNISNCIALWSLKKRQNNFIQKQSNDINQLRNSILRKRGLHFIQEILEEPYFQKNEKKNNSILNLIYQEERNIVYQDDLFTSFYFANVIVDKYQRRITIGDYENLIIINREDKTVEEIIPEIFQKLNYYSQSSFFKILIITNGTKRRSQISNFVDQRFNARKDKHISIKIKYEKLNDNDSPKIKWAEYLNQHNVFVLQAQEVLPLLEHGDITLDQFNLVIFDNTQEITKLEHLQFLIIKYFYFYALKERPDLKLPLIVASYVCNPVTGNENFQKLQSLFGAIRVEFSDECSVALKRYYLSNINGYIHNKQRVFYPHCLLEKALEMIKTLTNLGKLQQFETLAEIPYQSEAFFQQGEARFIVERSFQNLKDFWIQVKNLFEKYPESKNALGGKQQYTPSADQAQILLTIKGAKTRFYSHRIKNEPIIDLFVEAIQMKRKKILIGEKPIFYSRHVLSLSDCEDPALASNIAQICCQKEILQSSLVYLDFLRMLKEENYLKQDLRINRYQIDLLIRNKYHIVTKIDNNAYYAQINLVIEIEERKEEISKEDQENKGVISQDDEENKEEISQKNQENKGNYSSIPQANEFEESKVEYSNSFKKIKNFIKDVFFEVYDRVELSQTAQDIKLKDRNNLDQLLKNQKEIETVHIKELKKKMNSFLKLNIDKKEEINDLIRMISEKSPNKLQVPFKVKQTGYTPDNSYKRSQLALMYFVLCLQEEKPSEQYYEMVEEMERLSFVGTSAITLCTVIFLTITDKFNSNEKMLDLNKNKIIEKTNLSRAGKNFGFHREKYAINQLSTQSYPNPDASKIVQRLAGFFSLYLGIDACLYFLILIKVIPIPQDIDDYQVFSYLKNSLKQFKEQRVIQKILTEEVIQNQLGLSQFQNFQNRFDGLKQLVSEFSQDFQQKEESKVNHGVGVLFEEYQDLFLQCVTHSSFCDVIEHKQNNKEKSNNYSANVLRNFNFQRFEYLGDSILNFSIIKRIYFDTALQNQKWQRNYYTSKKLDDIKKFLTSNNFLGILLYHHFTSIIKDEIPLLYDQTSKVFSDDISKYNQSLKRWFEKKMPEDQNSRKSFSLDNFLLKQDEEQKGWKPNYKEVIDLKVKTFADIFEALVGATFIASENLGTAINFSLNMLSTDIFKTIDQLDQQLEQEKSSVTSIYGSKPYSYSYNLACQEKPQCDGIVSTCVFISTLNVKNITQKPQQIDRIGCLYRDIGKFLRDAYYEFEIDYCVSSLNQIDLGSSWFSFLHRYRTGHKLSTPDSAPKNLKIFRKLALRIVNLPRITIGYDESLESKEYIVLKMKKMIIDQYHKLAEEKKDERYEFLINLEAERVYNKEIREAFNRCDIKNLNPVRGSIKSFDNLLESYLQPHSGEVKWRVLKLYDQLYSHGELHRKQVHIDDSKETKVERSNSSESSLNQSFSTAYSDQNYSQQEDNKLDAVKEIISSQLETQLVTDTSDWNQSQLEDKVDAVKENISSLLDHDLVL